MNATAAADAQGAEDTEGRTGGCLCGRIRFTTRGPAVFPHTCACEHCQKLGGTPVMWWVGFRDGHLDRRERADLVRDLRRRAKRGFGLTCGSRVAAIDSDIPEIGINVTALDDTSGTDLVPIHASFRDNALHWLPPLPDTERSAAG